MKNAPALKYVHPAFSLNGVRFDRPAEDFFRSLAETFPHDEPSRGFARDIEDFIRQYLNDEPCVSCRTSGSTGAPKILALEKSRMRASARMTCRYFGLQEGTRALLCLPIPYIAGRMMLVRAMTAGWELHAVTPSSRPLDAAPQGDFDFAALVPLQLYENTTQLHRVRKILVGGAGVDEHFLDRLAHCGLSGRTEIHQSYAMTETITHVAVRRLYPEREKTYTALEGVRFSVSSPLSTLTIDAPKVAPERIETRDVVELIDPQHFIWRGRADTVINSGGIKLFPEDTEAVLSDALPAGRYFVTGVPDPRLGERQVLVIQGKESEFPHLSRFLETHFDPYHRPKQTVFRDEFPRTATGKIDRQAILALLSEKTPEGRTS